MFGCLHAHIFGCSHVWMFTCLVIHMLTILNVHILPCKHDQICICSYLPLIFTWLFVFHTTHILPFDLYDLHARTESRLGVRSKSINNIYIYHYETPENIWPCNLRSFFNSNELILAVWNFFLELSSIRILTDIFLNCDVGIFLNWNISVYRNGNLNISGWQCCTTSIGF